jgi:hypothetical protein
MDARSRTWSLSKATLPVQRDRTVGVRIDGTTVMWLGGDDPTTSNQAFIYDVRSRDFRKVSPVPAAKQLDRSISVGVLRDGSVVVAGGSLGNPTNRLSYRYHPGRDRWSRTDVLPEAQEWLSLRPSDCATVA